MSCNYADGLSNYENKGKLGLPEKFDTPEEVSKKVHILAEWCKEAKHTVFHTGAGISTSAGIPDFRGPNGVWTLEKQGKKPDINISWDDAKPTLTHMAIVSLERKGNVQYVVTQNIDGLHLRSGLQRQKLAELHGNMYVDKCNYCYRQFVRSTAVTTVGQKSEGLICPGKRANGRCCRGKLHDTVLDWEDALPDGDLDLAISHSCAADLSICLGTTLQIVPSGNLPLDTKKRGGKLVICNLQPTKQDRHADLIINTYVDDVMKQLLEILNVELLDYDPEDDPTKITKLMLMNHGRSGGNTIRKQEGAFEPIEWTIQESWMKDKALNDRVKSRKVIRVKRKSKGEDDAHMAERKKIRTSFDGTVKTDAPENDVNKELMKNKEEIMDTKESCLKVECDVQDIKKELENMKEERISKEHIAEQPESLEDSNSKVAKNENSTIVQSNVKEETITEGRNEKELIGTKDLKSEMNSDTNGILFCDVKNTLKKSANSLLEKVTEVVEMKEESERLIVEPLVT